MRCKFGRSRDISEIRLKCEVKQTYAPKLTWRLAREAKYDNSELVNELNVLTLSFVLKKRDSQVSLPRGYRQSEQLGHYVIMNKSYCELDLVGPYDEYAEGAYGGNQIVPLGIAICERFGLREQRIDDVALAHCVGIDGRVKETAISPVMLLRKGQGYYNRFGFFPPFKNEDQKNDYCAKVQKLSNLVIRTKHARALQYRADKLFLSHHDCTCEANSTISDCLHKIQTQCKAQSGTGTKCDYFSAVIRKDLRADFWNPARSFFLRRLTKRSELQVIWDQHWIGLQGQNRVHREIKMKQAVLTHLLIALQPGKRQPCIHVCAQTQTCNCRRKCWHSEARTQTCNWSRTSWRSEAGTQTYYWKWMCWRSEAGQKSIYCCIGTCLCHSYCIGKLLSNKQNIGNNDHVHKEHDKRITRSLSSLLVSSFCILVIM